jgi:hypothetical protein
MVRRVEAQRGQATSGVRGGDPHAAGHGYGEPARDPLEMLAPAPGIADRDGKLCEIHFRAAMQVPNHRLTTQSHSAIHSAFGDGPRRPEREAPRLMPHA